VVWPGFGARRGTKRDAEGIKLRGSGIGRASPQPTRGLGLRAPVEIYFNVFDRTSFVLDFVDFQNDLS